MTEVIEERNKIFVKNIPLGTTREDFIRLFSTIGPVSDIILPKPRTGYVTGYGFVTFKDEKDVARAISQYNNFELCNSQGIRSALSIVQAYQKVSQFPLKHSPSSSLWSLGSYESDKASEESTESVNMKYQELEPEWIKERDNLLKIIEENDKKIKELEEKNAERSEDELLDMKEKQLLEELERLPLKVETLKEEIEVLRLQVKLNELEKEQHQILGQ